MTELKDARELEKSYRYQLITSREMIANLQETVSQLVYLKRDVKKLKDELVSKDSVIDKFEKVSLKDLVFPLLFRVYIESKALL